MKNIYSKSASRYLAFVVQKLFKCDFKFEKSIRSYGNQVIININNRYSLYKDAYKCIYICGIDKYITEDTDAIWIDLSKDFDYDV